MSEQSTHKDTLIAQAQELHQLGLLSQALVAYNKALKSSPKDPALLFMMGQLQQDLDQHERAVNYFERAIKCDPSHALTHLCLSISLGQLTRNKKAVEACQRALDLAPELFEAHYQLATLQARLHDTPGARQAYHRALAINPNSARVHYNLGVLDQLEMKPTRAIDHYEQALLFQSDHVDTLINLSVALCEVGQIDRAKQINRRALSLNPTRAEAHFNAHTYQLDDGQLQEAIASLRRAHELAPQNEKYQAFLGVMLDYCGLPEQAAPFLSPAKPSKLYAADIEAWQYLSQQPKKPVMLANAYALFKFALTRARSDGLVLEFGVYQGTSINQIASLVDAPVHGFDSFEGIPEAWNDEPAGSYSTQGELPTVADNVRLHAGWFSDTIPGFISSHRDPVRLMNIDCDLYSSTETVLDLFNEQIGHGTVLVFDEFIGNESWRDDEFKAFEQAVARFGWSYEVIGFCFMTKQVAILITGHASPKH